jgi:hypothetical protein
MVLVHGVHLSYAMLAFLSFFLQHTFMRLYYKNVATNSRQINRTNIYASHSFITVIS